MNQPSSPLRYFSPALTILLITGIELSTQAGLNFPIPFLLLYATVVTAAGIGGLFGGVLSSCFACAFIIYSSTTGFGPPTLTGGPIQVALGCILMATSGILLGEIRNQRDKFQIRAMATQSDLEKKVLERTASLNDLVQQMQLQANVIEASSNAVLVSEASEGLPIIFSSPRFSEMTGYNRHEIINKNLLFNIVFSQPKNKDALQEAISQGHKFSGQFELERHDKTRFWSRLNLFPLVVNGQITHFVAVHEDITALRETELQLRQAQRLESLGQLTGGVAHDFNNILAIVQGNLELAKISGIGTESHYLDRSLTAVEKGSELTSRLLAYARKKALTPSVVNVESLITNILELLKRTLGDHIELKLEAYEDIWLIEVDPGQLENIIVNLASNARDAMPDGGKLRFKANNIKQEHAIKAGLAPNDYVAITVQDTGHGMEASLLERIFDPFFTTKEPGKGNGLGLAMAYSFVEQSGGKMRVSSEPGQGSEFNIYLPRYLGADKPQVAETAGSDIYKGTGERVLLVEDDIELLESILENLDFLNYRTVTAGSAVEAGRLLASDDNFDFLISDINLPGGKNGIQLAEETRRHSPHIEIVLMSANPNNNLLLAKTEQRIQYLQKPFSLNQLSNLLHQLKSKGE